MGWLTLRSLAAAWFAAAVAARLMLGCGAAPARAVARLGALSPLLLVGLLLNGAACTHPTPPAEAAPARSDATGTTVLPSDLQVAFEYHYDRNALLDSRLVGDSLIALTRAGHLLRFQLPSLHLVQEKISGVAFTSLGSVGNSVLAGRQDGKVYRVHPDDVDLALVAEFPGEVTWIDAYHDGEQEVYVAVARVEVPASESESGYSWLKYSVHDSLGRSWQPRRKVDVAHLDRNRQLWLGTDDGEWGGAIARIDLRTGKLDEYQQACRQATIDEARELAEAFGQSLEELYAEQPDWSGCDGVYGFLERSNGEIWVYGGTSHMGLNTGYIARLAEDSLTMLREFGNKLSRRGEEPPVNEPQAPITQIIEQSDGRILVFSYGEVFQTTSDLGEWGTVHDLALRYLPGRPDAVGSYPAITQLHLVGENPVDLILTTLRDGLVRLEGGSETRLALPGQLAAVQIGRIERSEMGLVVVEGRSYLDVNAPWRFDQGSWRPIAYVPEPELIASPPGNREEWWGRKEVFVGRSGDLNAVFFTNWSPGRMSTYRLTPDSGQLLGEQESRSWFFFGGTFVTPDDEWWATDGLSLLRFADGRWMPATTIPAETPRARDEFHQFRAIETPEAPWLLLDPRHHQLWRLEYGRSAEEPHAERIRLDRSADFEIYGGVGLDGGSVLLATAEGLGVLTAAGERFEPWRHEAPAPGAVRALARDGSGRLWLGGSGLWLLDQGGRLHDLSSLPMLADAPVADVVADPSNASGVAVSVGDRGSRGLVFVRAESDRAHEE